MAVDGETVFARYAGDAVASSGIALAASIRA
jgi:hypothetical protein